MLTIVENAQAAILAKLQATPEATDDEICKACCDAIQADLTARFGTYGKLEMVAMMNGLVANYPNRGGDLGANPSYEIHV